MLRRFQNNFMDLSVQNIDILSQQQSTLFDLNQYFRSSQNNGSVRGEILSARKIIDAYLHLISTLEDGGEI